MEETIHELKTWSPFFEAIANEEKTFEVRRNDRDFQVGDILLLREWDPVTDQQPVPKCLCHRLVTYVARPEALRLLFPDWPDNVVVLGLAGVPIPSVEE